MNPFPCYTGLEPGAVVFRHNPDFSFPATLADYMLRESHGRNWLVPVRESAPLDFNGLMGTRNGNEIWWASRLTDPYTLAHDAIGHFCCGASEGNTVTEGLSLVQSYGDNYTPMGTSLSGGYVPHALHNKIGAGFVSMDPAAPYFATLVEQSGVYTIQAVGNQTPGCKGLVILCKQDIITRSDGAVYSDKRNHLCIELRRHSFPSTVSGKGRKRTVSGGSAPGLQFREAHSFYTINGVPQVKPNIPSGLRIDIGSGGGIKAGQTAALWQRFTTQRTYFGEIIPAARAFSVTLLNATEEAAQVEVNIQ